MGLVNSWPESAATAKNNENIKHYGFLLCARHSVI